MSSLLKNDSPNSRRDFLIKTTLAGLGTSLAGVAGAIPLTNSETKQLTPETSTRFTILYTSDIHAQLHTHDEFFLDWLC